MRKEKVLNVVKLLLAFGLLLTVILNYRTLAQLDIRLLIAGASSLLAAELIILGVYAVKAVLLVLPASLIYISVGMAMDTGRAVAVNLLGILLEICITYFLGKFLGKSAVEKKLKDTGKADKLFKMLEKNEKTAVFLIRFIPAFPIDFSSLFMGAFGFRFVTYVVLSFLGLAPRVIAFTVLGDKIYELIPMKYVVTAVIIAIPAAVAAAFIRSKLKNKDTSGETDSGN